MSDSLELAFLHADACSFAAAMASSEAVSLVRLNLGRRILERFCQAYDGRVLDKVGDSMLLAFSSPDAAFLVAQSAMAEIHAARNRSVEARPFDYRIGITHGRVRASEGALYGHSINAAARIGSLVSRAAIGVESATWPTVSRLAAGLDYRRRRLFAKPGEPFFDFYEVTPDPSMGAASPIASSDRNEPIVALAKAEATSPKGNALIEGLLEALSWEFGSYFSSYGWRLHRASGAGFTGSKTIAAADYSVACGAVLSANGARIYASVSSPYMRSGMQTFSRETSTSGQGLDPVLALASLVGSAISQAERERAMNMRSAGVHQLVAAGRAAIAAFTSKSFKSGMQMLDDAARLDPEYPLLLSTLARAHAIAWRFGWLDDGRDHLALAQDLAADALKIAPDDARCEGDFAFVRFWGNEASEAIWHFERSLEVLPYHAELAADAGMVLGYTGNNKRAAEILERSIANIPVDVDYRLWSLGDVYHAQKEYSKSLHWLSRMRDQSQAQRLMVANKVRLGLDPSENISKLLAMQPDFSVSRWISIQPFTDDGERTDFEEALLQAGLPP